MQDLLQADGASERAHWLRRLCHLPGLAYRAVRWRTGHWLPDYLLHHRPLDLRKIPKDVPVDIIMVIVDHYEPRENDGPDAAVESVRSWCEEYERIAGRHRDADGRPLQHTWFYPAENPNLDSVQVLSESTLRGFGEVEFHLHHGYDTQATFAAKLNAGLDWFNQAGAMLTASCQPQRRFAYIAGNWALDNGVGDDSMSGCNTELVALREAGCYADFTFPALGIRSQPGRANALYYATDDPQPKSYDSGIAVAVGRPASGDLMIFQGPLVIDWQTGKFEDGALELCSPPAPDRLTNWLRAHIHVQGRPEWVFVKLHTHAIQSRAAFLSPGLDAMCEAMCSRWNRPPFRLHFATAREAYNMVKAAEAGLTGNPNDYREFAIPAPANRRIHCNRPWHLIRYEPGNIQLQILDPGPAQVEFAEGPLLWVQGRLERLGAQFVGKQIKSLDIDGSGEFEVKVSPQLGGVTPGQHLGKEAIEQLLALGRGR